MKRRLKLIRAACMVLALCFAASTLALVSMGADESEGARADCIFIPGMAVYGERKPSLGLQARLERALELWQERRAPLIVVSGGSKGDFNESEVMVEWLREHGVPSEAIIAESRSRSTRENAIYSAPLMRERGIKRALIVSQNMHLPRVKICLHDEGVETINAPCKGPPSLDAVVPLAREALLLPVHAISADLFFR
jgi:uncharacterized SAM-binding protein YcdF (DUF218 family)